MFALRPALGKLLIRAQAVDMAAQPQALPSSNSPALKFEVRCNRIVAADLGFQQLLEWLGLRCTPAGYCYAR